MKSSIKCQLILFLGFVLSSCALKSIAVPEDHWARPFNLTRMQYALLTNDKPMMAHDAHMTTTEPGYLLRALAGVGLPATATVDVLLFPVYTTVAYFEESSPSTRVPMQMSKWQCD